MANCWTELTRRDCASPKIELNSSSDAEQDAVDLSGDWVFSGFSENSGGTLGTLTLAKDATHLSLNFIGDYTKVDFAITSGATTVIGHT